jgi:hypothetical protein
MNIFANISYGMLVFLAVTWAWGIRVHLNYTLGTGLASLLLVVFAIAIPISGISRLHALWMIPIGMLFGTFVMMFAFRFFRVFLIIRFIGLAYMRLLRIGISSERLIQADIENRRRMEARAEALREIGK